MQTDPSGLQECLTLYNNRIVYDLDTGIIDKDSSSSTPFQICYGGTNLGPMFYGPGNYGHTYRRYPPKRVSPKKNNSKECNVAEEALSKGPEDFDLDRAIQNEQRHNITWSGTKKFQHFYNASKDGGAYDFKNTAGPGYEVYGN